MDSARHTVSAQGIRIKGPQARGGAQWNKTSTQARLAKREGEKWRGRIFTKCYGAQARKQSQPVAKMWEDFTQELRSLPGMGHSRQRESHEQKPR